MIPATPQPTGKPHPECTAMHEDGYCICLTVACVGCGKHHAPHKPCPKEKKP